MRTRAENEGLWLDFSGIRRILCETETEKEAFMNNFEKAVMCAALVMLMVSYPWLAFVPIAIWLCQYGEK